MLIEFSFYQDCPTDRISGLQLVFNTNLKKCDQPANVPSCSRAFTCPTSEGNYANPESCFSYYMCTYSKPYLIVSIQMIYTYNFITINS